MTTNITACLVIYNEEALIRRCLSSIRDVVDEIAVVHDGPCADRSLEICEEFGCQIRIGPRIGIAEPHRPGMLKRVRTEWVLQIDADEFLSVEAQRAVPALVRNGHASCFAMVWPIWDGHRYTTTSWPYKRVLYRRGSVAYLGFPQEEVRVTGRTARVPFRLDHQPTYNNLSFHTVRTKWSRWLDVHAAMLLADSSRWDTFPDNLELEPHYSFIAKRPLLNCAPVFVYHLLATLALGGWREGLQGLRVGLYTSLYYAALCLRVHQLKQRLRSG